MTLNRDEAIQLTPPNATDLEIDLVGASICDINEINEEVDGIATIKFGNTPDRLISFIIDELKLGSLSPYVPDSRLLIKEGVEWRRKQGTLGAVCLALSWIDRDDKDTLIEDTQAWHWTNVELNMGEVCVFEDVINAINLTKQSLPARTTLARVWSGNTTDMMVLNESYLNESLLNVPSGEFREDLCVWLDLNNVRDVVIEEVYDPEVLCQLSSVFVTCVSPYLIPGLGLNSDGFLNSIPDAVSYMRCQTDIRLTRVVQQTMRMADFINFRDTRDLNQIVNQAEANIV